MDVNVIDYAINCHASTNHLYDGKPYVIHLIMVVGVAQEYIKVIPSSERQDVISACWLHDVIEDCRQTYNDVSKVGGGQVADIVYAVTNEKGKTRKERACDYYYQQIKKTPWATFVKLCDRIANVRYSLHSGSRMLEVYAKENNRFLTELDPPKVYKPLVDELLFILNPQHNDTNATGKQAEVNAGGS